MLGSAGCLCQTPMCCATAVCSCCSAAYSCPNMALPFSPGSIHLMLGSAGCPCRGWPPGPTPRSQMAADLVSLSQHLRMWAAVAATAAAARTSVRMRCVRARVGVVRQGRISSSSVMPRLSVVAVAADSMLQVWHAYIPAGSVLLLHYTQPLLKFCCAAHCTSVCKHSAQQLLCVNKSISNQTQTTHPHAGVLHAAPVHAVAIPAAAATPRVLKQR